MLNSDYILDISGLSKNFGGLSAVKNCSLKIKRGSITGIIGPNGSGKSTLFNLIAGFLKPNSGKVIFNEPDFITLWTDFTSPQCCLKELTQTFLGNIKFLDYD